MRLFELSQAWLTVYAELDARYKAFSGRIVKMMNEPEELCGPSMLHVREEGAVYNA